MESFYNSLRRNKTDSVFNPWFDVDNENDMNALCPSKRLNNLKCYLIERLEAEYLFVAEALGYQGGHFTGIPLTSERLILGGKIIKGIFPDLISKSKLERTSKVDLKRDGFSEPSATAVWEHILKLKMDPRNIVFWNAFPWHPYNDKIGILSNRTPTETELNEGRVVLKELLAKIKFKKIIALGNEAFESLKKADIDVIKVRHPSYGGIPEFKRQIEQVFC
ncbi:MAG: uracil-DNA glycosylase [Ignavibacteriaceae bacterium]|nr:uracil-DNA glycosylase [Ignavibacteriaceae bacterium]